MALTLPSFAKINWVLRVLGRRPDGFHEIHTVFQSITLQDRLIFSARDDSQLQLTCDLPELLVDDSNLILRAAVALRNQCGVTAGASIHVEKAIPIAGGLGGGSSNAAIALLGLACLWEIKTGLAVLTRIGAGLGADVPFFLFGGTAVGKGLGTEIKPIKEAVARHLLVVTPDVKVSTTSAYEALSAPALTKDDSDIILSISRADESFTDFYPDALHNDFEPVVFNREPEIERARNALLNVGARGALLAGSGSSVFGVFENQEAQERAFHALSGERAWRLFKCATLTRAQYLNALGECAAPLKRDGMI